MLLAVETFVPYIAYDLVVCYNKRKDYKESFRGGFLRARRARLKSANKALAVFQYYYKAYIKSCQQQFLEVYPMKNQDIRRTAAGAGVKLWQIAEALGIADCSLSRKLRRELPAEEKEKIFSIIQELAGEVG